MRSETLMTLKLGELRLFFNIQLNGKQVSIGFPLDNCPDKRVWIEDKKGVRKVTFGAAKALLSKSMGKSLGQVQMSGSLSKLLPNS